MRTLFSAVLLATLAAPAFAQPDTPEATVDAFFASLSAADYPTAVSLLEPSFLEATYAMFIGIDSTLAEASPQEGLATLMAESSMFQMVVGASRQAALGHVSDPDDPYAHVLVRNYLTEEGAEFAALFQEEGAEEELEVPAVQVVSVQETPDGWRIVNGTDVSRMLVMIQSDLLMAAVSEMEESLHMEGTPER
ncbi:MAG: hypothetical protein AAF752_09705 [Bacteroidota bacterium]